MHAPILVPRGPRVGALEETAIVRYIEQLDSQGFSPRRVDVEGVAVQHRRTLARDLRSPRLPLMEGTGPTGTPARAATPPLPLLQEPTPVPAPTPAPQRPKERAKKPPATPTAAAGPAASSPDRKSPVSPGSPAPPPPAQESSQLTTATLAPQAPPTPAHPVFGNRRLPRTMGKRRRAQSPEQPPAAPTRQGPGVRTRRPRTVEPTTKSWELRPRAKRIRT